MAEVSSLFILWFSSRRSNDPSGFGERTMCFLISCSAMILSGQSATCSRRLAGCVCFLGADNARVVRIAFGIMSIKFCDGHVRDGVANCSALAAAGQVALPSERSPLIFDPPLSPFHRQDHAKARL